MAGQYDNLPPSVPSDPKQMFDTVTALAKATQEGMDKFYKLVAYLDQFDPQLITDATGRQFNALVQQIGFVTLPQNAIVPFGVSIGGTTMAPTATVNLLGSIMKSVVLDDTQTITGLGSAFAFIPGNDLIWIEGTIVDGSITAATINSYGLGGAWAPADLPMDTGGGSGPFEYDLTTDSNGNNIFTQTLFRMAVFSSVTSSVSPFPIINTQLLATNLLMEGDIYNGETDTDGPAVIGLIMPKPFSGPYIS